MTALVIIVVYLAILLWVGRFAHIGFSKHTSGDYFVASRSIGPFLLVMSVFGTTMTAFALVGSTGEAFTHGIGVYGLMASWSGLIHSACFFLIGIKLWSYGSRFNFTTQIQFFRDRFQSDRVGLILFPVLVSLVIPYLLIGILGSGATIEKTTVGAFPDLFPATKGGVPHSLGAALVCGVVMIYVFGGGVRSTAWANAFQTCVFMAFGLVALGIIAVKLGGPAAASQRVAEMRPDLLVRGATPGHPAHISQMQFLTYLFVPLSVAMFPHLFQHWMTAKSAKTFRTTVILHPIFIMLVWVPCIMLGVWASSAMLGGKLIVPPDANPNAVLGRMVGALTNDFFTGFLTVGVLAAIMSSLDSQFLALGSMFTHDIVLHYGGERRFSDKQRIFIGRTFVVAMVLTCYLLSLLEPGSVFALGVWCFSGFASLFPLVFAALYWKRATAAGAIASVLTAGAVWGYLFYRSGWGVGDEVLLLAEVTGMQFLQGVMPVTVILAASAAALVLVSLVTRPPSPEVVERYFPAAAAPVSDRVSNAEHVGAPV